jgi:hypothetical protein
MLAGNCPSRASPRLPEPLAVSVLTESALLSLGAPAAVGSAAEL